MGFPDISLTESSCNIKYLARGYVFDSWTLPLCVAQRGRVELGAMLMGGWQVHCD